MTKEQCLDALSVVFDNNRRIEKLHNIIQSLDEENPAVSKLLRASANLVSAQQEINEAVQEAISLQPTLKTA